MKLLLTATLLALPALALAQSQTVWRCGADGRSFSDQPCPQGRAMNLAVASRPAADIEAAQARALNEQRLADQLTQERLAREAASRGNGLGGIAPPPSAVKPAVKAAVKHRRKPQPPHALQPEDAGTWRAAVPASPRRKG